MIFKTLEKIAVGKKIYHISQGNEMLETSDIKGHEHDKVSMLYIENNVLHIVSKDCQYIADYFNYKNIESWGNYERANKKWEGVLQNY